MSYQINNISFSEFGIKVLKCTGAFDFPARMTPVEYDWHDENGVEAMTDEVEVYFKQRIITINCLIECSDIVDLQYKIGLFREQAYKESLLTTPYGEFSVIMKQSAKVTFIDTQQKGTAKFSLKFNQLNYNYDTIETGDTDSDKAYHIDGHLFSEYGIVVEETTGHFDFPAMKTDSLTIYHSESQSVNKRKGRNITMSCVMLATSLSEFASQMAGFQSLLATPDLRDLHVPHVLKNFEVMCKDGFKIKELYRNNGDSRIYGRFSLVLYEPRPKIESVTIYALLDTDGTPILTADGEYIYVYADRSELYQTVYLYTTNENKENKYLWTDNEFDSEHEDYNADAENVYLFANEELE